MTERLTAIIERDGEGYVALCPEFDIASQGDTVEEARQNLSEAIELYWECASPEEVAGLGSSGLYITQVELIAGLVAGT